VKATTIGLSAFLLLSVGLEMLVKDHWQAGSGTVILLALLASPFLIPAFLVSLPFCALAGRSIAYRKRRHPAEGITLGLLLGPLGVMIEGALANREQTLRR
jgi:hypothetical protein